MGNDFTNDPDCVAVTLLRLANAPPRSRADTLPPGGADG